MITTDIIDGVGECHNFEEELKPTPRRVQIIQKVPTIEHIYHRCKVERRRTSSYCGVWGHAGGMY